jgi:hypothetical protein
MALTFLLRDELSDKFSVFSSEKVISVFERFQLGQQET